MSQDFRTLKTLVLEAKQLRERFKTWNAQQKKCLMYRHESDSEFSNYFYNWTGEDVEAYKMLDTHVGKSSKIPLENRFPTVWRSSSHYTPCLLSFVWIFPNSWIGRYDPPAWPAGSPHLTSRDVSLWGFLKVQAYRSFFLNPTRKNQRTTTAIRKASWKLLTTFGKV